ncbi:MAG: hypothetical protein HC915_02795 [Anaerolineae bacterium]|nr:hypothetical protein [Anaerolineae bacterium]
MGDRVIPAALQGKAAQFIGSIDTPHTYTYMPDIGKALVTLGQHDEALGRAWHLPSPPTTTTRAWLEAIYASAGQPFKVSVMPPLMVSGLSPFVPILRELKEMLYEFNEPHIMRHDAYAAAFGDHASSFETAVETTVRWYRDHHAAH